MDIDSIFIKNNYSVEPFIQIGVDKMYSGYVPVPFFLISN